LNSGRNHEAQWLADASGGDIEAFTSLVQAYQRPVFSLCYRMLGNAQDAEDAAQETFLKAFRHLARYDPQRRFLNWILAMASNHCIDQIRRSKRRTAVPLEALPEAILPADTLGPEAAAQQADSRQMVQQLTLELEATDRAALMLYYWHDMSYEGIAAALGISISAVKSRLYRARRQLAEAWMARTQEKELVRDSSTV
jgi:RNA polymerase sigma-70 factor (ECF subfamily)